MNKQQRALIGFVLGAVGLAVLQSYTNRQATALGVPHAVAGLIVGGIAHELGPV